MKQLNHGIFKFYPSQRVFLPRSSFTPTDLWANQTNNRGASPLAATERKTNGFIWRPGKSEKSENFHGVFGVVLAGGLGFFRMELEWIWMDYKHGSWVLLRVCCWSFRISHGRRKNASWIALYSASIWKNVPQDLWGKKNPTGWMFPVIRLDPFSHKHSSVENHLPNERKIHKDIRELHDTFSTLNHFLWEDTGYQFRDVFLLVTQNEPTQLAWNRPPGVYSGPALAKWMGEACPMCFFPQGFPGWNECLLVAIWVQWFVAMHGSDGYHPP